MNKPKISVIIPVYNEEKEIIDCLESLGKQTYQNFEIIAVDDGSTDNTLVVIGNFQFPITNFQLLKQNHKGPGAARNLGVRHAKGEILVFVDADMTFDEKFLSELVEPIIQNKSKGTFSKNEYVSNWGNVWAKCWNINEGWEPEKRHPRNYPDRQKVFRAILKSEFNSVEGFTPGGYTDDYSLAEKLGYEAEAADGAIFYHKNPDNLKEVYLQAKWAAKRKYKFGLIGYIIGLMRTTLPISILTGIVKSVKYRQPLFIIFKIVYDAGSFSGILNFLLKGRGSK